jgi:hypothetical protein
VPTFRDGPSGRVVAAFDFRPNRLSDDLSIISSEEGRVPRSHVLGRHLPRIIQQSPAAERDAPPLAVLSRFVRPTYRKHASAPSTTRSLPGAAPRAPRDESS